MTTTIPAVPLSSTDRFYIDGDWVKPSTDSAFDVLDSHSEELYFRVAEAQPADMDLAIGAARRAFDHGPWPRLTHAERAGYLRAMADKLELRANDYGQIWPRESGVVHSIAQMVVPGDAATLRYYADLAFDFPFEEVVTPSPGPFSAGFGLRVREPVGVVGAITPWNAPLPLLINKLAPALLAGCTVVAKMSPEAPAAGYLLAEVIDEIGLPRRRRQRPDRRPGGLRNPGARPTGRQDRIHRFDGRRTPDRRAVR